MLNLMKLESRIVLDGAAAVVAGMALHDVHDREHDLSGERHTPETPVHHDYSGAAALLASDVQASPQPMDVVLVADNLTNYQTLINAVTPGAQVMVYKADSETAEQVIERVAELSKETHQPIGSVTILSHGGNGYFSLGSEKISADTLDANKAAWDALHEVMTDNGKIYVFGCETGTDQALLHGLSKATGASVFASNNTTGNGGDWVLETASDNLGTASPPLNAERLSAYSGTLEPDENPFFLPGIYRVVTEEDAQNGAYIFEVGDADQSPSTLSVSARSLNQNILKDANISTNFVGLSDQGYGIWKINFTPETNVNNVDFMQVEITIRDNTGRTATKLLDIRFDPKNDAPVLDNAGNTTPDLARDMRFETTEDWTNPNDRLGHTVAEIVATSPVKPTAITDVDANALLGIAIIRTNDIDNTGEDAGTWQYCIGDPSVEANWHDIGNVSESSALLLRDTDRIRFKPAADWNSGRTTQRGISDGLVIKAWDQTSGTAGTKVDTTLPLGTPNPPRDERAFSRAEEFVGLVVQPENDSPSNPPAVTPLTDINEDPHPDGVVGCTPNPNLPTSISKLITETTDKDGDVVGIAIIGTDTNHGKWQYNLTGGVTQTGEWNGVGTWVDVGTVADTKALLLAPNALLRFVPNDNYYTEPGTADALKDSITFRHWDQVQGTSGATIDITQVPNNISGGKGPGGISGFSEGTGKGVIDITPMNDAPMLVDSGKMELSPIHVDHATGDAATPGDTVADILKNATITDIDKDAKIGAIAVTFTDNSDGQWQYDLGDGKGWQNLGTAAEPLSETKALLLLPTAKIRFLPNNNWDGQSEMRFRAWDQTDGKHQGETTDVTICIGTTTAPGNQSPYSSATGVVRVNGPDANPDYYETPYNTTLTIPAPGVLANDTDIISGPQPLTSTIITQPGHGTVTLAQDGSFLYTPTPGFSGVDTFTYYASDGQSDSNVTTVAITVGSWQNVPPVAYDGSYATSPTVPVSGVLQGHDPDNGPAPLTYEILTPPSQGTVTHDGANFIYTPGPTAGGSDSFIFRVYDGAAWSNPATITISFGGQKPPIPEGPTPEVPEIPIVPPPPQEIGGELGRGMYFPGTILETPPGPRFRAVRSDIISGEDIPPVEFCSLEEALTVHLGCRFANTLNPESKFSAVRWNDLGWPVPYLDEEYDLYSGLFLREEGDAGFNVAAGELAKAFGMEQEARDALLIRNEEYDLFSEMFIHEDDATLNQIPAGEMKRSFFRGREHQDVTMRGLKRG